MSNSKVIAKAKVRKALELIEQAQRLVVEACEELSPISGMCSEWERVCKLHDKVKAEWHRLNKREGADDYDLDGDAKARLAEKERGRPR